MRACSQGALVVLLFHLLRIDEQLHAQVDPAVVGAEGFPEAPLGKEKVSLDAGEVVLGLGVHHAKHRVRIRGGFDVGNAPLISGDRHLLGSSCPARLLSGERWFGRRAAPPPQAANSTARQTSMRRFIESPGARGIKATTLRPSRLGGKGLAPPGQGVAGPGAGSGWRGAQGPWRGRSTGRSTPWD